MKKIYFFYSFFLNQKLALIRNSDDNYLVYICPYWPLGNYLLETKLNHQTLTPILIINQKINIGFKFKIASLIYCKPNFVWLRALKLKLSSIKISQLKEMNKIMMKTYHIVNNFIMMN